jgi:hypothetical protein
MPDALNLYKVPCTDKKKDLYKVPCHRKNWTALALDNVDITLRHW